MNRTNYPHEILPKQNWKQYVPPSEIICVCQDAILGRMLEGREEDCLDSSLGEDMVSILPEKLPLKRIAGLSCSLLGTTFIVDFFHYLPSNEGKEFWKEGILIQEDMINENNYTYYPDVTVVGWRLKEIHEYKIPYKRNFQKKKDYNEFRKDAISSIYMKEWEDLLVDNSNNNRIVNLTGKAQVSHFPTMLNFWHYTIELSSANNKPIKKVSDGWQYNMAKIVQDFLLRTFIHIKDDTVIPKICNTALWTKCSE